MLNHHLKTYPTTNWLCQFLRPFPLASAIALLTLCLALVGNTAAQAPNTKQGKPAFFEVPTYPDSPEGLQKLIEDGFGLLKSERTDDVSAYFSRFALPESQAWFARVFGAAQGAGLDAKYQQMFPELTSSIRRNFEFALSEGSTTVTVTVFQRPLDPRVAGVERAVVDAMAEPVRLYTAYGSSPQRKSPMSLGQFFYVRDGFRYVDGGVLQALATAPPPATHVAGNAQQARLTHKIDPIYPEEAKAAHIAGTVFLRATIATDGSVKDITVVRGNPILASAAVDVVRLWQYEPTVVKGKPVEVQTTISVPFRLPLVTPPPGTNDQPDQNDQADPAAGQ